VWIGHGADGAGSKSGSVISSVSFEQTTCTGMSHLMAFGSGSTLTRLVISRGPSASSTIASTKGGLTVHALLNAW